MTYIDARHSTALHSFSGGTKPCFLGCLTWLAGILAGVILFLIFLLSFQPELFPESIRQIPQKASQALSQLGGRKESKTTDNPVAILMYHYIRQADKESDPLGFSLSVSPTVFEKQIEYLAENFEVIGLADFATGKIPEKAIILTFDDGYEDFYTAAAPILKKYNLPSASFVITSKIGQKGYLSSSQIKELSRNYQVDFGSHSVSHLNLSTADYSRQALEISQSQSDLEKIISKKVNYFCYPSGKYNQETLEILTDYGYKLGVTVESGLADRRQDGLTLPRVRVSGNLGLEGLKENLSQLFKDSQPGAP